ncbi:VWA domain-containing protein [Paenibacillus sp. MMS20-IR301]|uniref:vWA domain-containing protein n=1 Tax=Paenibacillus sp. MMS20-IR301 TaxID=2895946 RepID=UPI0028E8A1F5|nr:VWA domain-containing protein [Paenibacillus sp. MMS20-IR301]WNS41335.1 VWA domain-containing protein [Paenibacillus sp. MMS20-IR301]
MQRKINLLLLLFSLLGGGIAFVLGELLLDREAYNLPMIVLVGIYFAIVALGVGAGSLAAETISPKLNGQSWKLRYLGTSWKMLPLAVVLLFGLGTLTEFLYELNFGGIRPVKNVVMVIDNSGSMLESDPNNSRYEAARSLVQQLDEDNKVAVVTFDHDASVVQPLIPLSKAANREQVSSVISSLQTTEGGTNISGALTEAMTVISTDGANRGAMVILLSDGISEFNTATELTEYVDRGIAVNTIGLALDDPSGSSLLQDIAGRTGGQYYDVADAGRLGEVFQQIYDRLGDRTLLTERSDATAGSPYYAVVRILALILIGTALGLGLGIVFDNRHLARSFSFGGALSGLGAGLILEFGLRGDTVTDPMIRLLAVLVLVAILTLFTYIVPVGEGTLSRRGRSAGASSRGADSINSPRRNRGSKGF